MSTSTAVFWRDGDETRTFAKLGACRSVTVISQNSHSDLLPLVPAERRTLTVKELLALNPECAYTADSSPHHDQFVVKNQRFIVKLTPESDNRFGLVSNQKTVVKGQYAYDLNKPLNKRVMWALDNTITQKYEFFVHLSKVGAGTQGKSSKPTFSRNVRIAVPPLEYALNTKKRRREAEGADEGRPASVNNAPASADDIDLDLLGFDDWTNELVEWAGLAVLNPQLLAEHNGGIDAAICDYFHPENSSMENVAISHFQGPFSAANVQDLWNSVQGDGWTILIVNGVSQLVDRPLKGGHHKPKLGKFDGNGGIFISTPPNRAFFDFWGY